MRRLLPLALGLGFFLIPAFPALIVLARPRFPGIALLPPAAVWTLFAAACAIALYGLIALLASPPRPLPTVLPFASILGASIFAALIGFGPQTGIAFIVLFTLGIAWHATIVRFFDADVAFVVFAAILISGTLASILAVAMAVTARPTVLYVLAHGRAVGTFVVPGELAGYLIVFVPFAYALARTGPGALRSPAYAGLLAGAIAFILSFSRAGWVGMAAALACFFAFRGRQGGIRIAIAIAIVGIAAVTLVFVFNAHHDPSENFTRLSIWRGALAVIERFPLTGIGPFDFPRLYAVLRTPDGEPSAMHAHSLVLTLAAELGAAGLTAVGFAWWRFTVTLRERLAGATQTPTIALAITAGLIGTWVQGLIDTVSIVIFALWPGFTALALASIPQPSNAAVPFIPPRDSARLRWLGIALAIPVVAALAYIQLASDAVFSFAAAGGSFPSRLSAVLGVRMYATLERIAPLPFVERTLADAALRQRDVSDAERHTARLPSGAVRSELEARIAVMRGRDDVAVSRWLEAGDDGALQRAVTALAARGRYREAYALEARVRDRLERAGMRPNALADCYWRLGRLALRLARPDEAGRHFDRAAALAPLNTKYLLDAALVALERRDADRAWMRFARVSEIDPGDAAASAGMGLAALLRGDLPLARRLCERARRLDGTARLTTLLRQRLLSAQNTRSGVIARPGGQEVGSEIHRARRHDGTGLR